MPIYEYRCPSCGKRSSRLWTRMPSATEEAAHPCPACGAPGLARVFSRFARSRPRAARADALIEGPDAAGIDEGDPRAMARLMRGLSEESGEAIEGEDAEMLERMEAGEMPPDDEGGGGDDGEG